MVTLKIDRKAKDCWLITTTDSEGYHRQLPITFDDMRELVRLWIDEVILVNSQLNKKTMNEEERQQMLKGLEREAANDLWNFLQDVADGIKNPKDIKTDDQWPVTNYGN